MFKIALARYESGNQKYVILDNEYDIYSPTIPFINELYEGYKLNTRRSYVERVVRFLNFLETKNLTYDKVTSTTITNYINYLQGYEIEGVIPFGRKILGKSINTNLTAIAKFYQVLDKRELLVNETPFEYVEVFNPNGVYKEFLYHAKINKGRVRRRRHKATSDGKHLYRERRKSYKELNSFRNNLGSYRDVLIFDALYETGMRISELLNLTLIDYSEPGSDGFGQIRIIERPDSFYPNLNIASSRQVKTGSRTIDVSNDLIKRLDKYIVEFRPFNSKKVNQEFIFLSSKKDGSPLTRQAINKIFSQASSKCGIKITPHDLRHTHITELTEAGYDDLLIMFRSGHSSIYSLNRYQHPSMKAQQEAYIKYYENRRKPE